MAAILAPATSYLFTWVLLSSALALLLALAIQPKKEAWGLAVLGFLVSTTLAIFLWIPVLTISFSAGPMASGISLLSVLVIIAALWIGSMIPILDWITSLKCWFLSSTAALVALGFLLAGNFLVGRNSPPPMANSIGYWLNADGNEAWWVVFIGGLRTDAHSSSRVQTAFPEEMDERQINLFVDPVRRPYTDLFPAAPAFSILTNDTPSLVLEGPHLDVVTDEWDDNRRVMTIRLTTSMHDRLYLIVQDAPILGITVPNNERTELGGIIDWRLRLDDMPVEGVEIGFEFSASGPIHSLLVEEKTGLPSFPDLVTQPLPGTMQLPGEFYQGTPTDFTAINRNYVIQGINR